MCIMRLDLERVGGRLLRIENLNVLNLHCKVTKNSRRTPNLAENISLFWTSLPLKRFFLIRGCAYISTNYVQVNLIQLISF